MRLNNHKAPRPEFYLCLKIGDDIVSDGTHFPIKEKAEDARQRLLATPTMRCQDKGYISTVVLHHNTLQRLIKEGVAVTTHTLKQNALRYGWNVASASKLYENVEKLKHLFGAEEMKSKVGARTDWHIAKIKKDVKAVMKQ